MKIRQLRYLVALNDERHFTRAAAREHVAQPALSQQIRKLESEVGLALVDRTTRRVSITEAGALLVDYARVMLRAADDATEALEQLAGLEVGRLSIGTTQALGPLDLAAILA